MADLDQAFFEFAAQRGVISVLEAESLRTELQRKRTTQKDMSAQALLVRKGHVTDADGETLFQQFQSAVGAQTLAPASPDQTEYSPPATDQTEYSPPAPDQTEYSPAPETGEQEAADETNQKPVHDETGQAKKPTTKRPSGKMIDSRSGTNPSTNRISNKTNKRVGQSTTNRVTNKVQKDVDWGGVPTDALSATDKMVPAGTIISGGTMSIADVRVQAGLDEGVKLISNKMDSTVAHLQPDAASEQRRYVVIREIARGGMGKVLEVEDTELRRSVALKVLRKELIGRADIVERFLEEAQITGQLEHPNIVPVHEMGVDGAGNLYFTMKYVEGLSLAELLLKLREGNRDLLRDYPLTKLLDIFIRICESISFAHSRGVIHRDLKPANIMVGKFGEVQVMDWGVAKVKGREVSRGTDKLVLTDRLDANTAQTMAGAIIGTPSYMSPEQAKGDIESMGAPTDIFSLGVILYEMLSQRSPWTGRTSDEVLEQVREKTPDKPGIRNDKANVPKELSRLAMRCLEKDPEKRLTTVKELGQNIRNYIEGRTMGAVEYSAAKVFSKWVSRHRGMVMAAIGGVVLVVGAIFGTMFYLDSDKQAVVDSIEANAKSLEADARKSLKNKDYKSAILFADQSHDTWQKANEISQDNETATSGMASIKKLRNQIRDAQVATMTSKNIDAQTNKLIGQAEESLDSVKAGEGYYSSRDTLIVSWEKVSAALEIQPDNASAKNLKAKITKTLAKLTLERRLYSLCDFWLIELEATGLLKQDYEKLRTRWQNEK